MSTLLVGVGHVVGGGEVVDLTTIVVLFPLLLAIPTGQGRRPSLARTAVSLGAAQFVLHGLIDLSHAHPLDPGITSNWASGLSMLFAHALATLLIAVLLRDADRLVDLAFEVVRQVVTRRPVSPRSRAIVVLPAMTTRWSPRLDPVPQEAVRGVALRCSE